MVRAVAGEIVEMKERRSKIRKKAAKIKKSELVRFLATAPETKLHNSQTLVLKKLLNSCRQVRHFRLV
jgi:hypothetical protein